jgi:hypothetical protein
MIGGISNWLRSALPVRVLCFAVGIWTAPPGWCATDSSPGSAVEISEDQLTALKAGHLVVFARYTLWPSNAFSGSDTPLRIGVLGRDPIGKALEKGIRDKRVQDNRAIELLRAAAIEELLDCHLIYIAPAEIERLGGIMDRVRDRPILLVGDGSGFLKAGGMIELTYHPPQRGRGGASGRLEYKVDVRAAERVGIRPSSELLRFSSR